MRFFFISRIGFNCVLWRANKTLSVSVWRHNDARFSQCLLNCHPCVSRPTDINNHIVKWNSFKRNCWHYPVNASGCWRRAVKRKSPAEDSIQKLNNFIFISRCEYWLLNEKVTHGFSLVSHKVPIVVIVSLRASIVSDVEISCPWRIFSNHHTLLLSTVSKVLIWSRDGSVSGVRPAHISFPFGDSFLDGELLLDITAGGHFATVGTSETERRAESWAGVRSKWPGGAWTPVGAPRA